MTDINDILIFAKVAEYEGISAAARALNIPKSKISRRMAMLEQQLGTRLLERSTRAMHLTEAGRIYYQHCQQINEAVENAENAVHQLSETPRGQLRVSASVATGQQLIAPYLSEFSQLYPLISIDLELANRRVDLISEGFDLAFRIGELEDSSLISKRIGGGHGGLFASPDYLDRHSTPESIQEVVSHRTLVMSASNAMANWLLKTEAGEQHQLSFTPNIMINDLDCLLTVVAGGAGIACLPTYMAKQHPQADKLQRILPEWHTEDMNFYILYPSQRGLTHKARLWIDFFSEKLRGQFTK